MKPITEQNNTKAIRALKKLNYMTAMEKRIESVYETKKQLGRLGFTEEFNQIVKENSEAQDEMIERFNRH